MRTVMSEFMTEGMVLARTLFTETGTILLKKGTTLTEKYIRIIQRTGIEQIFIQDEISEGVEVKDVVDEQVIVEVKSVIKDNIEKIQNGELKASEEILKQVEVMMNSVLDDRQNMISIQKIRNQSDYLFYHSINVSVLSLVIAKKMKLPEVQMYSLAVGALLHDIGKVGIKMNCNRYHDDYTEEEQGLYRQHVDNGFEVIKNFQGFSLQSANIARTHHERYDGTGFPLGLKGKAINVLSRVVSVANEYDNLLNNAYVKLNMKNHEIIEYITAKAYTSFDPDIIKVFRQTVTPFPLGVGVVLSDGRIGIVIKLNAQFPNKPVIRIIDPNTKKAIEEIDLSKERALLIRDEIVIDKL